MPKKNGRTKKKFPQIKKDIKDFLLSEEGKVSKKNIAKLGVSLAVLAVIFEPEAAAAHNSSLFTSGTGGHTSAHSNHSNHGNHGNHGNHSSGGWC